ncbi:hypothetical protein EC973_004306 [Apophysomyces ossiformis]|uniref:PSP1 C-terminal domain-containing protein n=1 Tax=Apophysomyces ossiformis TaxID=679940 RepID=A0A8H7EKM5_9FUNG|nr:hypothetical protein EC973_004306 [Apophysomyces ossiformis]
MLRGPLDQSQDDSEAEQLMKMKASLPYRRHSLAHPEAFHDPVISGRKRSPSSSFLAAKNAMQNDSIGSIWSQPSVHASKSNSHLSSLFPRPQQVSPSPSVSPSLFSGPSFGEPRPTRRLSLSPLPSDHANDYFEPRDMLSSVPEEQSLAPYRRHSLAGPLLPVATSSRGMQYQFPNRLLSSDLMESVDACFDQPSWCMVEFKAGRAEIYYSLCPVEIDDWVIVEADRGRDLGKVVARDLPPSQVTLLLQTTNASENRNAETSPKRVCRLATASEITLLVTKRQDEQKALLICQTKSQQKNLLMDIVDAEYQWDRRKLTFYFVAERRVDFRELVRDLFKIYKTRIWM